MFQYKKILTTILFLLISSTQCFAQNTEDYSVININVDVQVNSGEIEVNPLDLINLKVSIYGTININIYGIYDPTLPEIPTPKRLSLSISPNPINTTLTPIIIPPTNPGPTRSQSTETDLNRVLLGRFNLGLMNPSYSFETIDYLFTLGTREESSNALIDQEEVPIEVFNPKYLPDLEITNAEILRNNISGTRDGILIKAYIVNSGREDIKKKSSVTFYYKKEGHFQLLGSAILGPLDEKEQKAATLSISDNVYQDIVNDYITIVADANDDIFEISNNNNTLEYYVPKIELGSNDIKIYPNPFNEIVNFTFFMNNESNSYVTLTIYDYKLNVRGKKRYRIAPGNSTKTISYSDSSLPEGKYLYSLLINNNQYLGTIIKKQ